jgi:zinc transport system ATP-binding protein
MTNTRTLIGVQKIGLIHQQKTILEAVSFELKLGDFVTLIGPNGAGKSSLIKILLGLLKPSSGSIYRADTLKLGYTPQKFTPNAFIPISVLDFLQLNQSIKADFFQRTIDLTGVKPLLSLALQKLSGGETQRVLLTRALLGKPNVLVLDEPAQNLDIDGQTQFYQLLQTIHQQQNCAILMVSHDLHRVMRQSSQVLCLYHHICCMGKPETILQDSRFEKMFANQKDELMTTYAHHHNHQHSNLLSK